MKWSLIRSVAITSCALLIAIFFVITLWRYYEVYPRTPDGKVRADIVLVAPDVSGLVSHVYVHDNQRVKTGDVLFEIDKLRFALELKHAQALLAEKQAALTQATRVVRRNTALGPLVPTEEREKGQETADVLSAELRQAEADVDTAKLNLDRSTVRATVDGKISNLNLVPGAYTTAGKAVFALIDLRSIHVDGYFEETKLQRIHVGDKVRIRLMGDSRILQGHVASIAGGIEDRDRGTGGNLLADVNPTFSWVRLAQRIPVRIAIDERPADIDLVLGRTAAVEILQDNVNAKQ